jgi:hypothetical protein
VAEGEIVSMSTTSIPVGAASGTHRVEEHGLDVSVETIVTGSLAAAAAAACRRQ